MDNPSSPLETLRQLKEMLDAGALTPAEFEALKQRLVFSSDGAIAATPPVAGPAVVPPASPPPPAPIALEPLLPELPRFEPPAMSSFPPFPASTPVAAVPFGLASEPATSASPGPSTRVWEPLPPVPPLPPTPTPAPDWVADELPESLAPPARSPLALILSIGGLLALLALVMYLSFNRRTSEHISSTSQTAADTVRTPIETGPQAEPMPLPAVAAETVRVRPTNPAPFVQPRPIPTRPDSVAPLVDGPTDSTETP